MPGKPTISVAVLALGLGLGAVAGTDSGAPASHEAAAAFEGLFATDVRLTSTTLEYSRTRGAARVDASASLNTLGIDYQPAPFDFLGLSTPRDELRAGGFAGFDTELVRNLRGFTSVAAYTGYSDYRSVWFDEYYRQQFSTLPGYSEAAPRGEAVSTGLRWEYLAATGYLQADVGWRHDVISPGYEIDFDGLRRGRPNLYTAAYRFSVEQAFGRRLRVLQELRITETSDRDVRLAWQGAFNLALGERWTLRCLGGFARENPTFEAHFLGGAVEYESVGGWAVGVTGRFYRDTGEIENSNFSNAAPGVDAWQAGVSLRRSWGSHTLRLGVSPYFTRYQPYGIGTAFFQNLYRDRDWALVQLSFTTKF